MLGRLCRSCYGGFRVPGIPCVFDEGHCGHASGSIRGVAFEGLRRDYGDGVPQSEEGQRLQSLLGEREPDNSSARRRHRCEHRAELGTVAGREEYLCCGINHDALVSSPRLERSPALSDAGNSDKQLRLWRA